MWVRAWQQHRATGGACVHASSRRDSSMQLADIPQMARHLRGQKYALAAIAATLIGRLTRVHSA